MSRRRGAERRGVALFRRAAPASAPVDPDDPVEVLIARARRCRHKGDTRKALVLLREACSFDEWRARTWAIAGALCASLGRNEEAAQAYRQARWLRLRAGERARVAVLDRLLARMTPIAA
jgi:Flp pilus assembly protein TadD